MLGNGKKKNINSDAASEGKKIRKILGYVGVAVVLLALLFLTINAIVSVSRDDYFTSFGGRRMFAVNTDAMGHTIPRGSLIICDEPNESLIDVNTVITFKISTDDGATFSTRRVVSVELGDELGTMYVVRGDNERYTKSYKLSYSDVVGVYTGDRIAGLGAVFGFINSPLGILLLIVIMLAIIAAMFANNTYKRAQHAKKVKVDALKKSAQALSTVNLRYDNIVEITAVMDVLGMITETPKNSAEAKATVERLEAFVRAENLELPQTPETAAILDSLPAPDTPGSLAAALSAGATLRQAENGQTLVLTTISGGKNILLTPVQTADGVILCPQGVRIRAEVAPDIENIGVMSMPTSPAFFEGRPLEKNVEYPELPQPTDVKFGTDMLLPNAERQSVPQEAASALSSPVPSAAIDGADRASIHALPGSGLGLSPVSAREAEARMLAEKPLTTDITDLDRTGSNNASNKEAENQTASASETRSAETSQKPKPARKKSSSSGAGTSKKQGSAASNRKKQTAADAAKPKENAETTVPKPTEKPEKRTRTPEQIAKAKEAAARRRKEKQEYLASLSAEEREKYLAEQKSKRTAKKQSASNGESDGNK